MEQFQKEAATESIYTEDYPPPRKRPRKTGALGLVYMGPCRVAAEELKEYVIKLSREFSERWKDVLSKRIDMKERRKVASLFINAEFDPFDDSTPCDIIELIEDFRAKGTNICHMYPDERRIEARTAELIRVMANRENKKVAHVLTPEKGRGFIDASELSASHDGHSEEIIFTLSQLYYKDIRTKRSLREVRIYNKLFEIFEKKSLSSRSNFSTIANIVCTPNYYRYNTTDGYFISPPAEFITYKNRQFSSEVLGCITQLALIYSEFEKAGIIFTHNDIHPGNYVWATDYTPGPYDTTEGLYKYNGLGRLIMYDLEFSSIESHGQENNINFGFEVACNYCFAWRGQLNPDYSPRDDFFNACITIARLLRNRCPEIILELLLTLSPFLFEDVHTIDELYCAVIELTDDKAVHPGFRADDYYRGWDDIFDILKKYELIYMDNEEES